MIAAGQQQPEPHLIQPPPQDDPTTNAVGQVLAAAASYEAAKLAIGVILAPFKVSGEAIEAALRLSGRGTKPMPRPKGYHQIARRAADQELYYRAAYVVRASARIQADLDSGLTLQQAVARERRHADAHEAARKSRLVATLRVVQAAQQFGPVLGWYLDPLLNNESECKAANGNNYYAEIGTIIGYPGTVHVGCGCIPGPPWPDGGWVDEAVRPHVRYAPRTRILRPLRRKAS